MVETKEKKPYVKITVSGNCCDKILRNGEVLYWHDGDPVPPVCIELAPQLCLYLYHLSQGGRAIDGDKTFIIDCPDKRNKGKSLVTLTCEIVLPD